MELNNFRVSFAFCVLMIGIAAPAVADKRLSIESVFLKKTGFPVTQALFAQCRTVEDKANRNKPSAAGATMVVLHGSGGAGQLQSLIHSISQSACRHHLRIAALAAPNERRNWPFDSPRGEGQDRFLMEFLREDLPARFKLNKAQMKDPLLLVGVSAGATFLMADFYPRHANQLRGLALALCGGAWPNHNQIVGAKSLNVQFPLFVQIGTSDFLFEQVKVGLTRYAEMGLPVRASFIDGAGHCAFDFNRAIDEVIKSANFFSDTGR